MKLPLFASRLAGNSQLFWKKNGATVLTGVAVVGVPTAMVLTGMATVKTYNMLPQIKLHMQQVRTISEENGKDEKGVKQEIAKAQVKTGLQVAKVYSPAIAVAAVSITCLVVSHGMMRKREAQLVGAFVALEAAFQSYRKRVAEKIGEDEESKLYHEVPMRVVQSDDGEACYIDFDATQPSIYTKFFDETCDGWSKDPEYNLMFLRQQQNWANDRLRARGHVFLNEVYDALGIPRTQAGQIVGWLADANKRGTGDSFIDFGIYQIGDAANRAFVNGYDHTVGLDFNCDGVIIERL